MAIVPGTAVIPQQYRVGVAVTPPARYRPSRALDNVSLRQKALARVAPTLPYADDADVATSLKARWMHSLRWWRFFCFMALERSTTMRCRLPFSVLIHLGIISVLDRKSTRLNSSH